MAYLLQQWFDEPIHTTPFTAARMLHIEQGIFDAAAVADTLSAQLTVLVDALLVGTPLMVVPVSGVWPTPANTTRPRIYNANGTGLAPPAAMVSARGDLYLS
jgi:hypothetical protein